MGLYNRLCLAFTHGPELERIAHQLREQEIEQRRLEDATRLKLCYRHRQEANRSHYAEHNCDYCKALRDIREARESRHVC